MQSQQRNLIRRRPPLTRRSGSKKTHRERRVADDIIGGDLEGMALRGRPCNTDAGVDASLVDCTGALR